MVSQEMTIAKLCRSGRSAWDSCQDSTDSSIFLQRKNSRKQGVPDFRKSHQKCTQLFQNDVNRIRCKTECNDHEVVLCHGYDKPGMPEELRSEADLIFLKTDVSEIQETIGSLRRVWKAFREDGCIVTKKFSPGKMKTDGSDDFSRYA